MEASIILPERLLNATYFTADKFDICNVPSW
jgi:hypothetical protein